MPSQLWRLKRAILRRAPDGFNLSGPSAPPERFELPTRCLEHSRSCPLNYGGFSFLRSPTETRTPYSGVKTQDLNP